MTKKEITQLSYDIVGCAITVHKTLGPGLLESVYEKCLKEELEFQGFKVETQQRVKLEYRRVHETQLLTYMSLLEKPQGLLINFYTDNITKSVKPLVNQLFKNLNET